MIRDLCAVNSRDAQSICMTYFIGFLNGYGAGRAYPGDEACPADNLTPDRIRNAFVLRLMETPTFADLDAADVATFIISDQKSCPDVELKRTPTR